MKSGWESRKGRRHCEKREKTKEGKEEERNEGIKKQLKSGHEKEVYNMREKTKDRLKPTKAIIFHVAKLRFPIAGLIMSEVHEDSSNLRQDLA
jgi:hypothetical protein